MARTNKYSSINFNEIYDKKINTNKSSSASSATSANSSQKALQNLSTSRIHGGMLVLTRPTPKPQPQIHPQPSPSPPSIDIPKTSSVVPDQPGLGQDSFSLRPLGHTGSALTSSQPITITQNKERESSLSSLHHSPKPEPFVPPHLRPGFVGKEERLARDGQKNLGFRSRGHQVCSPNQYGEDGRPKSGGYERIYGGVDSDQEVMNRPSSSGNRPNSSGKRPNSSGNRPNSSGNRPNSSGWYGSSSYRSPHHF